jgi:DNA-binding MarR family transcriptional regulator
MAELNLPTLPCMCASFRRSSRALTQLYEKELRPLGLRATQLTILQVLSRAGEMPQGKLGEILAMDSTSLTRTLAIMIRRGWITERRGEDKRERWLRLSSRCGRKFNHASGASWDRAPGISF